MEGEIVSQESERYNLPMSPWETYPQDYRQTETARLLAAVRAGECASVIGLSGAGKSNLLGFLAHRASWAGQFVLVDGNRLPHPSAEAFYGVLTQSLGFPAPEGTAYLALEGAVSHGLARHPAGLCLLLDRFDALDGEAALAAARNLRALRDAHKYTLTFVTATRRPLDPHTELAELVFGNTLWLGPLSPGDTDWNIHEYARRKGQVWDTITIVAIRSLSGGYPALLRAVCEAHGSGSPLEPEALRGHPAIQRRLDEFWADAPTPEMIRLSGLGANPLLGAQAGLPGSQPPAAEFTLSGRRGMPEVEGFALKEMTAKESMLFEYFRQHAGQVCGKDALIRAVWPEDRVFEQGVRDDSLAQLVRRLRKKVEAEPDSPVLIQTIPGRGYLFRG